MIYQTTNPRLVDAVINHPDVRPTVELGDDALESLEVVQNPDNVFYALDGGVGYFIAKGDGVFSAHMAFMPGYRGKAALVECKSALERIFRDYEARKIVAAVPLQLRAARLFARRLGFASTGKDSVQEHFSMEAASWAA